MSNVSAEMKRLAVYATLMCAAMPLLSSNAGAGILEVPSRALLPRVQIVSTIPSNGDLNPYGTAFVPHGFKPGGPPNPGDLLISNFNDSNNTQGTGSTIVSVKRDGQLSTFFSGTPGLGLTLALGLLRKGFVIVGSVPTLDGTDMTVQQGALLIIDDMGTQLASLTDPVLLDGPWGLAIDDQPDRAHIFVANVLNGTITRIDALVGANMLTIQKMTTISSGYAFRFDVNAIVLGPTGLVYDAFHDVLYIASTADNEIFRLRGAGEASHDLGKGEVVYKDDVHLHGPLGLVLAPNGHLIAANADAVNPDPNQPSEIVEFTTHGQFVTQLQLDLNPAGPFGIALTQPADDDDIVRFAAVNDNNNSVSVYRLRFERFFDFF